MTAYSYADDHLQLVLFTWQRNPRFDGEAPRQIGRLIKAFRNLLDDATSSLGCGINPAKSEIVSEFKVQGFDQSNPKEKIKRVFKWLGYGLKVENGRLDFDEKFLAQKQATIRQYVNDIFQYAPNISVRMKIFTVYIAPILEYFLPVVIRTNINKRSSLESFQHELLCKVAEVPHTASSAELLRAARALSISERLQKACLRYRKYLEDDETTESEKQSTGRTTRSGKSLDIKLDKNKFADRIRMLALEGEKNLLSFKKGRFSPASMSEWAKKCRDSIKAKIALSEMAT